MKNEMVTIFTPVYNRADCLQTLYNSLKSQKNQYFEWLIVDDGSTDNLNLLVDRLIAESNFKIHYIYQENSGKHVAHNTGVDNCKTSIFFCVDSDDYLSNDCVNLIYEKWKYVSSDENLAGVIALKKDDSAEQVKSRMPEGIYRSSIYNLYYKHKFKGDAALIFKTQVLREFKFPVYKDEKFITEGVVYDLISQSYEMYLMDHVIYYYEYLPDGYSANIHRVHKESPYGYLHFLKQRVRIARNDDEKDQSVIDFLTGNIMILKNPFLATYIPKWYLIRLLPKTMIRLLKIIIKNFILKKI